MDLNIIQNIRDGKAFSVNTGLIDVPVVSEYPLLLLRNPAGSDVEILTTHFKSGVDSSSVRSILRLYKIPTVTSPGTALTIESTLINSGAPSSGMECYMSPTISDVGELLNLDIHPVNSPTKGLSRFYWIFPGHDLLITVENSAANADSYADIYWVEGV